MNGKRYIERYLNSRRGYAGETLLAFPKPGETSWSLLSPFDGPCSLNPKADRISDMVGGLVGIARNTAPRTRE